MRNNEWNMVIIMKHAWNLISNRNCTLLANWVKDNKIKNISFWNTKPCKKRSQTWKKILNLKKKIKPRHKVIINNMKTTFLWHDNWHRNRPLKDRYDSKPMHDMGLDTYAKVEKVVVGSTQNYMPINYLALIDIRTWLNSNPQRGDDIFIWLPNLNGGFSIRFPWNEIQERKSKIEQSYLLWFKKNFPRHFFILWLVIWDKLITKDKLVQCNIISQDTYSLC